MRKSKLFCELIGLMICVFANASNDSLNRRNQVWIQLCGNNFFAIRIHNDSGIDYISPLSMGYSRKSNTGQNHIIFSTGIGVGSSDFSEIVKPRYPDSRILTGILGVLYSRDFVNAKPNKRNRLWIGVSMAMAFGSQKYSYRKSHVEYVYETQFSFSWNPEIAYELQSHDEHVAIRLSYTPKVFVDADLNGTWFYNSSDGKFFPLYGGMTISYQW
jgi:hypothetical protein